jgi:hypothetical protein
MFSLLVQIRHLCGMDDVEQDHDDEHQKCVEDVKEDLVTQKISVVALDVFHDTEDAPEHDKT